MFCFRYVSLGQAGVAIWSGLKNLQQVRLSATGLEVWAGGEIWNRYIGRGRWGNMGQAEKSTAQQVLQPRSETGRSRN